VTFGMLAATRVLVALVAVASCDDSEIPAAPPRTAEPFALPTADPGTQAAAREGPPVRKDGTIYGESELMGTRVSINVWLDPGREAALAGDAMDAALAEMARIEDIMSEWRSHSEVSLLNRASGSAAPLKVSEELVEVLVRSKAISEATDGMFDVTFHAVGQLWTFTPGATPPSAEAIGAKLPLVDWHELEVDEASTTARLRKPGMMIGLGAIAKGYAVDRASAVLRQRGFHNHVVEAGGDTYASGTKGGKKWMVGVQDPQGPGTVGVLPTSNRAVVTSGGYQRYFEHQGQRYAHILDPKTGWPIALNDTPTSVTVLAPDATDGDAYCTAVTVMGAEKGLAFVETRKDLDAVIITRNGALRVSSGLRDTFIDNTSASQGDLAKPRKRRSSKPQPHSVKP
jgi:thiamine biosynthesis lipoprotein